MKTTSDLLAAALADHRAGHVDRAAAAYRQLLESDPANADALHLLGLTERQAGRLDQGLALVRHALTHAPDKVEARLNLGNMLAAKGDAEAAQAQWRAVLALDPSYAAAWHALGAASAGHGGAGRPAAIRALRRAAALTPDQAEIHHDLGLLLRQDDRNDEAIACQRRALSIQPGLLGAWMSLGNALLEQGETTEADAALKRAISLSPGRPEIWFNLGNLRYRMADLEAALACYRRSAQLGLAAARARVVAVLVDQGQDADAEAALVSYLPLDGTDVSACLEMLYLLLVRGGRRMEARAIFTRLETAPLAGRIYPVECRTALSALDLEDGDPATAAARLEGLQSDNCWMFTIRSLAALERTRRQQGWHWQRPANPDPARPRLASSTLGNRGRFAHNVLEYVLLRLYAEKHGGVLETPDWVGGAYFELDDPAPSGPLPPWPFGRRVLNGFVTGERQGDAPLDRDALSPLFLYDYPVELRDRVRSWLRPRPQWAPWIDPPVDALRAVGNTVVAIHIRRGDFLRYGYPITETQTYVDWLRDLWPTLDKPVLYLASDDIPGVRAAFREFRPVTLHDAGPAWPGLEFLQDFHVLTQADIVGISAASGFSQLAARLNERARLCVEPDMETGGIKPFVAWT
ncbi:tetratricopeptide repeat protein [Niveispirillum sp. KHB5.9]|uniref:tetratricopeptide repeat protein n=1 Tax=Niveispirillum sp. KHB5.9 TaxID=3400269 RepID=UPI003A863D42